MKYPRVEISYATPVIPHGHEVQTLHIEPEASEEMTMAFTPAGFMLTAFSCFHSETRSLSMNLVRRWGMFDEPMERALFEDACYTQYLRQRNVRRLLGIVSASDKPGDVPWEREEIFVRGPSGDYIAIAYQQAWGGWKLARGAQ